jgi:hypothetical protein
MATHRCTRCKVDQGKSGRRHKYKGGVYCDPCYREIGASPHRSFFFRSAGAPGSRGFFGRIWDKLVVAARSVRAIFAQRKTSNEKEKAKTAVAYSTMNQRARSIPRNPSAANPQTR